MKWPWQKPQPVDEKLVEVASPFAASDEELDRVAELLREGDVKAKAAQDHLDAGGDLDDPVMREALAAIHAATEAATELAEKLRG